MGNIDSKFSHLMILAWRHKISSTSYKTFLEPEPVAESQLVPATGIKAKGIEAVVGHAAEKTFLEMMVVTCKYAFHTIRRKQGHQIIGFLQRKVSAGELGVVRVEEIGVRIYIYISVFPGGSLQDIFDPLPL